MHGTYFDKITETISDAEGKAKTGKRTPMGRAHSYSQGDNAKLFNLQASAIEDIGTRMAQVHTTMHELYRMECLSPRARTYGDTKAMTRNTQVLIAAINELKRDLREHRNHVNAQFAEMEKAQQDNHDKTMRRMDTIEGLILGLARLSAGKMTDGGR